MRARDRFAGLGIDDGAIDRAIEACGLRRLVAEAHRGRLLAKILLDLPRGRQARGENENGRFHLYISVTLWHQQSKGVRHR